MDPKRTTTGWRGRCSSLSAYDLIMIMKWQEMVISAEQKEVVWAPRLRSRLCVFNNRSLACVEWTVPVACYNLLDDPNWELFNNNITNQKRSKPKPAPVWPAPPSSQ